MSLHLYRATVRGHFADLDAAVADRLRAEADQHDYLHAAYTPTGTFVYDRALVAFSIRSEIRIEHEVRADADALAEAAALERARTWLAGERIGAKHLRVAVINMASTWERAGGGVPEPRRTARRR